MQRQAEAARRMEHHKSLNAGVSAAAHKAQEEEDDEDDAFEAYRIQRLAQLKAHAEAHPMV